MRIWITGLAGFLGSHLRDALLNEGHEVYGNDSLICGDLTNLEGRVDSKSGANCALVDCRDQINMAKYLAEWKPDVLVHCAATAAEGFSVFSPHFITKNIAEASVSTFSAAIAAGVKRIVFMSSMARYGHGEPTPPPFTEDGHVPSPIDPYGKAKVYAEDQLKILCAAHGVKWSILVPHNVVGTRQEITPYRNVVSIFLNRLRMNMPVYIYGDGEQKRSFSPVKDCLPCIVRAVYGEADGQVVNIGPDRNEITINRLLDICERVTGIVSERVYLPPRPVTDDVTEAHCSSDKSRRLLGYTEQQSIVDCIKEMAEAINPKPFNYSFPVEIVSDKMPKTWREKL